MRRATLTRARLIELLGEEKAAEFVRTYGGHRVPKLTPKAADLDRRDEEIRAALDAVGDDRQVAEKVRLSRRQVVRIGQMRRKDRKKSSCDTTKYLVMSNHIDRP